MLRRQGCRWLVYLLGQIYICGELIKKEMKRITSIIAFIAIAGCTYAQDIISNVFPTKDGRIYYSEIIKVDSSLTADNLYQNAKSWASLTFRSAKDATQSDDPVSKTIIIKSYVAKGHNAYITNPQNWFVLKIEMKDGRYKYTLTDVRYEFSVYAAGKSIQSDKPLELWVLPSGNNSPKKQQKINDALTVYLQTIDADFKAIIADMTKSISTPVEQW